VVFQFLRTGACLTYFVRVSTHSGLVRPSLIWEAGDRFEEMFPPAILGILFSQLSQVSGSVQSLSHFWSCDDGSLGLIRE